MVAWVTELTILSYMVLKCEAIDKSRGYLTWSAWGECMGLCDKPGVSFRTRDCFPGEMDCTGYNNKVQKKMCRGVACAARWGAWAAWSECSVTCGEGVVHRSRKCETLEPPPCTGELNQTSKCVSRDCIAEVKGVFAMWSDWSECSVSCGAGTKQSDRHCLPSGAHCSGFSSRRTSCNLQDCTEIQDSKKGLKKHRTRPSGNHKTEPDSNEDKNPHCDYEYFRRKIALKRSQKNTSAPDSFMYNIVAGASLGVGVLLTSIGFMTYICLSQKKTRKKKQKDPEKADLDHRYVRNAEPRGEVRHKPNTKKISRNKEMVSMPRISRGHTSQTRISRYDTPPTSPSSNDIFTKQRHSDPSKMRNPEEFNKSRNHRSRSACPEVRQYIIDDGIPDTSGKSRHHRLAASPERFCACYRSKQCDACKNSSHRRSKRHRRCSSDVTDFAYRTPLK